MKKHLHIVLGMICYIFRIENNYSPVDGHGVMT